MSYIDNNLISKCLTHLHYHELFPELSSIVESPKLEHTQVRAKRIRTAEGDVQQTTEAGSVSTFENNSSLPSS